MASPLLYDFRRTLTSKSVLIVMGVLIVISLAVIPFVSVSGGGGFQQSPVPQLVAYHDSSGYHFFMYAANQFGQGVAGYSASVTMYNALSYKGQGTSNSSGYSTFLIQAGENPNYTIAGNITFPGGTQNIGFSSLPFSQYNGTKVSSVPDGQIISLVGGPGINSVPDSKNSSVSDVNVFFVAPFGKPPSGYTIYYKFFNSTGGPINFGQVYNQSQMQELGTLSGYVSTFSPPQLPSGSAKSSYFVFQLFYPNGTALTPPQIGPQIMFANQLYAPPPPPIQPESVASQFFAIIFAILIPLMAIIGSYSSYGKDRVTGVLESVLSRPVTRRGLSISRFLSTFAAMTVAVIVSVAVVDGIVYYYSKAFIDTNFLLASTGGFIVELGAFVGIMMFLSHLVKGSGALIGIGIGIFILFDLFWSLVVLGVAHLAGSDPGTVSYYQISTAMNFVNPAQFVSLINTYLTGQISFGFVTPSDYGITIQSLVVTGVLWIVIPFVIFVYLAMKRD